VSTLHVRFWTKYSRAMRLAALLMLAASTVVNAQSVGVAPSGSALTRRQIEAVPVGLPDGTTRGVTALSGAGGPTLLASIDRHAETADVLTLWAPVSAGFRAVRQLSGPEDPRIGHVVQPRRFAWRGRAFLHLSVQLSGTGALHDDEVLHLSTTGDLTPVAFVQAPVALSSRLAPGEGVWKGAFYEFEDDRLSFEFSVWKEGDGNCCPTGGRVTGHYVLREIVERRGRRGWVMDIASFVRHPPDR
jgi:hypothetical protein